MNYSTAEIWIIILALGAGTFLIRFSFLGLFGRRQFPPWLIRHLRYTPAAVLPGLVAPLVLWPAATGGAPDAPRLAAAITTLAVGFLTRSFMAAVFAGAATLYGLIFLGG